MQLVCCIEMVLSGRAELRASVASHIIFIFLIQNHQKTRNSRSKSTATLKKPKRATHERETMRRLPDNTKVFTDQRRYPRVARERLRTHAKVLTGQDASSKSSKTSASLTYKIVKRAMCPQPICLQKTPGIMCLPGEGRPTWCWRSRGSAIIR